MADGVIFVAGTYGVGKSTLGQKLSQISLLPFYSAGDLISEVNGESYGANKVVQDKNKNQGILVEAVDNKLQTTPSIILAGHFCIFDKETNVDILPEHIFELLHIQKMVLLETSTERIAENLNKRDGKDYSLEAIETLKETERRQSKKIAKKINVPLLIHEMVFSEVDVLEVGAFLKEEIKDESTVRH